MEKGQYNNNQHIINVIQKRTKSTLQMGQNNENQMTTTVKTIRKTNKNYENHFENKIMMTYVHMYREEYQLPTQ